MNFTEFPRVRAISNTMVLLEFTEAITIDGVDVPAYGDGLRDFAVIAFDLYSSEVEWSRVCRGPGDDRVTSVATHSLQYFNSFFAGRSAGALECDDVAGPIPEGDFIWIDKRTPQLPAASYFFPLHGLEQAVVMPHMLVAKHVGATTDLACDQPAPQVPSWIAMRLPP